MKNPHQNGGSDSDLPPFLTTYEKHEKAKELPRQHCYAQFYLQLIEIPPSRSLNQTYMSPKNGSKKTIL
jgi:hypothetical protein